MKDWAKEVSQVLFDCAKAPSDNAVKPFPWKPLSEALEKTFEIDGFAVELASMRWAEPAEFMKGMGRKPRLQPLHFSPLTGAAFWVISSSEVRNLMGWLISDRASALKLPDPEVEDGFFEFLCLEALHTLDTLRFFKKVNPSLGGEEPLPKEAGLLVDLTIKIGEHRVASRMIVSPELYREWSQNFAASSDEAVLTDEIAEKLQTEVSLEIGNTRLSFDEWSGIQKGDCLILDQCSWRPGSGPCPVTISLGGKPLLSGVVEKGQLKILDFVQVEKV